MAKVKMPQLGESVTEGTIGRWLKKPGEHVDKYEPIVEVITDKVNAEVPSPFAGTLTKILVEEGATVPNNAEIAEIDEGGTAAEAQPEPAAARGDGRAMPGAAAAMATPAPAAMAEGEAAGEPSGRVTPAV
ncbi:MAG TPA: biotin/lipoyl-containing protein, partial [Candidatus Limnocylindrales bacterium]|nr:biotin/lipoyl-containing protein [Candidatus Limnocylindrales bacterium]